MPSNLIKHQHPEGESNPYRGRREFFVASSSFAVASLLPATAMAAQPVSQSKAQAASGAAQQAVQAKNGESLSADDPRLSPRASELIRIGNVGIARENAEALNRYFHPDFVFHGTDGSTLNREQLWSAFAAYRAAFDNFSVTRQMIFSDGKDHVASQTTFSGVFVRPFSASPVGLLKPSGKPFVHKIHNIFRFAEDGRLIEEWVQYDNRLFLESLGANSVSAH